MRLLLFLIMGANTWSSCAHAENQPECLDGVRYAVTEKSLLLDTQLDQWLQQNLLRTSTFGAFETHARANLHLFMARNQSTGAMENFAQAEFDYPLPPNQVGLFYTVYAVEVKIGADGDAGQVVRFMDYTKACHSGITYVPGAKFRLPGIIIPMRSMELHREEPVRLKIWGQQT